MKFFFLSIFLVISNAVFCQIGIITTVAGNGSIACDGDGGSALLASIGSPAGIVFDHLGNYYFSSGNDNETVRKVSNSGIISTIAGTGVAGFSGDGGPATSAELNRPAFIAVNSNNDIYFADAQNNRIRRVDAITGFITTVAGNGVGGYSGDGGPATSAKLNLPFGICFDNVGNIYLSDQNNFRIRKIDTNGIINTYAGTGSFGVGTDGILANTSEIGIINGICTDFSNNLYISDGNRIRKIDAISNVITTFAGGITGYEGNEGPATAAGFDLIEALVFNSHRSLYVADMYGETVRVIDTFGIIHRVAGTDSAGFTGDGGADTAARLYYPEGVGIDQCGNLLICDLANSRIRKVTFNFTDSATIIITGVVTAATGSTVTLTATLTDTGSSGYSIQWYNDGVLFATTTIPTVSYTKTAGTDTITAIVIPVAGCNNPGTAAAHTVSSGSVGIIDAATAYNLVNIYPNPATSTILISSNEGISSATVLDLMGREVAVAHSAAKQKQVAVDIVALPAGVYVVKVDGAYVSKMVKE